MDSVILLDEFARIVDCEHKDKLFTPLCIVDLNDWI